eukprot:7045336-Pyramimonas_sp.AAC.1
MHEENPSAIRAHLFGLRCAGDPSNPRVVPTVLVNVFVLLLIFDLHSPIHRRYRPDNSTPPSK